MQYKEVKSHVNVTGIFKLSFANGKMAEKALAIAVFPLASNITMQ
jgi:hypothetical protein